MGRKPYLRSGQKIDLSRRKPGFESLLRHS